jgi:hypothetical protein
MGARGSASLTHRRCWPRASTTFCLRPSYQPSPYASPSYTVPSDWPQTLALHGIALPQAGSRHQHMIQLKQLPANPRKNSPPKWRRSPGEARLVPCPRTIEPEETPSGGTGQASGRRTNLRKVTNVADPVSNGKAHTLPRPVPSAARKENPTAGDWFLSQRQWVSRPSLKHNGHTDQQGKPPSTVEQKQGPSLTYVPVILPAVGNREHSPFLH